MKLLRITTIPISLDLLLTGQMKFMKSKGFEVVMISADGDQVDKVVSNEGCRHIVVPFTRKISPFQDLSCLLKLIRIIRKERPDIIHTHTPKAGLLGMLAARICGVTLKMHTIAGLPFMTAKGFKKKLLVAIEKITFMAADYVLPNSETMLKFVKDQKLTSPNKLSIIGRGSSNGIDLKRFSKSSLNSVELDRIKISIQYNPQNIYLLAVGRMVRDKGIMELIKAFQKSCGNNKNIILLLVGPFENIRKEELLPNDLIETIENSNNIIHVGWSDYVEYYMYLSDVFIHASHREGFPNVLLQAGAMECPIICSNISGNVDIVKNNKTGLYFDVKDSMCLSEVLTWALSNMDRMNIMSKNLRAEIEESYNREFIHNTLLSFYRENI